MGAKGVVHRQSDCLALLSMFWALGSMPSTTNKIKEHKHKESIPFGHIF